MATTARVAKRALLAAAAALVCLVAAAAPGAAPSYGQWSAPVSLGPIVNGPTNELTPALTPDGLSLYFDSDRPGGLGGRDIWVSHRASVGAPWGPPVNVGAPVNTASGESGATFSSDGHWMFFSSDRPGGFGRQDLQQSYRENVHDDFGWQTPTNLGAPINGVGDDGGPSYFDNGGHPQLYFSIARGTLTGGRPDLFVTSLQADGTWGNLTQLVDLNSPALEFRPTLRPDGLEIFFYSDRPGGAGSDLWTSTRATVDVPWSTPVNVGAALNTAGLDSHPHLLPDGRTLIFASDRPGGSGGTDLYVTTRAANLMVTASDQSRLFGQANPPLTYKFTGFVGGESAAVVSGTASCSTTATPSSPAGDYPITCTAGTLSAPGYVFETFVAGTLTVSYSRPCLTGPSAGPLRVAAGEAACIGAGGSQTGPVTVGPGGSLDVEDGRITGPVVANGAAVVRICGATITGPITISGSTGPVLVGGEGCDPNTIVGPVRVTDNAGGAEVNGNTVVGPLRVTGNAAPTHAAGNTVTGPATIQP